MAKLRCANPIAQCRGGVRRELAARSCIRPFVAAAVLMLFPALVACDRATAQPSDADFDRLCAIYEEISTSEGDGYAQTKALLDRIEREVPEIYQHYEYLSEARAERVYGLLQDVADNAGVRDWQCQAVKTYYAPPESGISPRGTDDTDANGGQAKGYGGRLKQRKSGTAPDVPGLESRAAESRGQAVSGWGRTVPA